MSLYLLSLYLLAPFLSAAPGAGGRVVVAAVPGEGDLPVLSDTEKDHLGVARVSREVRLTAVLLLLVLLDKAGGVVMMVVVVRGDDNEGRLGVARVSREVRRTAGLILLVLADSAGGVVMVVVRGDLAVAGDDSEPRGEAA